MEFTSSSMSANKCAMSIHVSPADPLYPQAPHQINNDLALTRAPLISSPSPISNDRVVLRHGQYANMSTIPVSNLILNILIPVDNNTLNVPPFAEFKVNSRCPLTAMNTSDVY
jgi:hypothetical protein